MTMEHAMNFEARPSFIPMFLRSFLARRPRLKVGEPLPSLSATWNGIRIDVEQLRAYNLACGFSELDRVSLLYPHAISSPLQLALITSPRFPAKVIGVLHQRNHILQRRAIGKDDIMDATCRVGESRPVKQGIEFDILTTIAVGGVPVWEGISTYLLRKKVANFQEPPAIAAMPDLAEPDTHAEWQVAPDMGRRYARLSGDFNPIHVSSLAARVFGFPRAFVHGMWTASACVAHLEPTAGEQPVRYDIAFKGPVYLGEKLRMDSKATTAGKRFDLFCDKNPRPVLKGMLRPVDKDETLS